jgi:hypothetical protein
MLVLGAHVLLTLSRSSHVRINHTCAKNARPQQHGK